MSEMLDVLDENGNKTGRIATRNECYANGWWIRGAIGWIINSKGEILIQQRSFKKSVFPGIWDKSVSGAVDAGEDGFKALVREAFEELGINIMRENVKFLGNLNDVFPVPRGIAKYIYDIYVVHGDFKTSDMVLQESEVAAVKYVTPQWIEQNKSEFGGSFALKNAGWELMRDWLKNNK